MNQSFAVLLPKTLPQELIALLDGYLYIFHEQNFLLCSAAQNEGYFLAVEMLKNDTSKKVWKVKLPLQFVLAVTDMFDKESLPIGFLSSP